MTASHQSLPLLVTGNIFRFRESGANASSQKRIFRWLAWIVRAAVQNQVAVDTLLWEPGGRVCQSGDIYRKAGLDRNLDGYAKLLGMELDEILADTLEAHLAGHFIVGFEWTGPPSPLIWIVETFRISAFLVGAHQIHARSCAGDAQQQRRGNVGAGATSDW
ncbi:MAG: hypothetical protein U5O39_10325 [Gammaproteobacteria bacterium]|nr:hypothetical protein [Gammaproteobacteria bacterium]